MAEVRDISRLKFVLGAAYFGLVFVVIGGLLVAADNLYMNPSSEFFDWLSVGLSIFMTLYAIYLIRTTKAKIRLAEAV
jgi:hypothetical protein